MEASVTEETNLLLDYIGKFINQTLTIANPAVKSTESQSLILDSASKECEQPPIDVESCVPYINYLGRKESQVSGLNKVLDIITDVSEKAEKGCDIVLEKERCARLVSSLFKVRMEIFKSRVKLLQTNIEEYHKNQTAEKIEECFAKVTKSFKNNFKYAVKRG